MPTPALARTRAALYCSAGLRVLAGARQPMTAVFVMIAGGEFVPAPGSSR